MGQEGTWEATRRARRTRERWEGLGWLLGAAVLCVWGLGVGQLGLVVVGVCLVGHGVVRVFGWDRSV